MTPARRAWRFLWTTVPLAFLVTAGVALAEEARTDEDEEEETTDHAESLTREFDCDICHTPAGWKIGPSHFRGKKRGFDHATTGFPLEGRHLGISCMLCHGTGSRPIHQCSGCHESPHSARRGGDCDRCHRSTDWREIRAEELHSATRFPLTGMHLLADCTECHQRRGEGQWSSVPTDCYGCHADEYRRTDIHPRHTGSGGEAPFPRDCSRCHRPTGWSPAVVDPDALPRRDALTSRDGLTDAAGDHDVRFPITFGAHRGAACADCHPSSATPRAVRCTGCHAHNPIRLRQTHRGRIGSPEAARCLACHPGGVAR